MCHPSYLRHQKYIYQVMSEFFYRNIGKVVDDIKDFYAANGLGNLDEHVLLDIFISLNGAYQRRGRESTYCITFAIESHTVCAFD